MNGDLGPLERSGMPWDMGVGPEFGNPENKKGEFEGIEKLLLFFKSGMQAHNIKKSINLP